MAPPTIDREALLKAWKSGVKYKCSHLVVMEGGGFAYIQGGADPKEWVEEMGAENIHAIYNLKGDAKAQMAIDRPWNL